MLIVDLLSEVPFASRSRSSGDLNSELAYQGHAAMGRKRDEARRPMLRRRSLTFEWARRDCHVAFPFGSISRWRHSWADGYGHFRFHSLLLLNQTHFARRGQMPCARLFVFLI